MQFPSFHDRQYLAADSVLPTDRLIKAFVLWMIPSWITPNHITLFRMLATPFTVLFLYDKHYAFGIPLFVFVAFTDAVDGALARTRNMITPWGMMFDPLADKFLIIPCLIVLMFSQVNPVLAVAIIALECIIIFLAFLWRKAGHHIQANVWGKIKMFLQVMGVVILLLAARLDSSLLSSIAAGILVGSIAFSIMSILDHGV
ncbi:MAG: CDP-alcohol phosphatidyltransferase family protein [Patescibacteria group bacterium]